MSPGVGTNLSMTSLAPSRSWILAGCTTTANSKPTVSTMTCRFRPLTYQHHSHEAPFFSRLQCRALGVGFLPSASRTQGRSVSLTRSHVPSMVQLRKYLYRVCQGGLRDHPPHPLDAVHYLPQVHCTGSASAWLVGVDCSSVGPVRAAHSSSLVQVQDFGHGPGDRRDLNGLTTSPALVSPRRVAIEGQHCPYRADPTVYVLAVSFLCGSPRLGAG